MIEPTLADLFADARGLLEGKTMTKVYPAGTVANNFVKESDPAYDALWKVVLEPCPHHNSAWRDAAGFQAFCADCGVEWSPASGHYKAPDGYVLRIAYWEQAPNGALEGALKKAVLPCFLKQETMPTALFLDKLHDLGCEEPGDTRILAMQALVKWLRGEGRAGGGTLTKSETRSG